MSLIAIVALDDFFIKGLFWRIPPSVLLFNILIRSAPLLSEEEIPKSPVERRVPLVE